MRKDGPWRKEKKEKINFKINQKPLRIYFCRGILIKSETISKLEFFKFQTSCLKHCDLIFRICFEFRYLNFEFNMQNSTVENLGLSCKTDKILVGFYLATGLHFADIDRWYTLV